MLPHLSVKDLQEEVIAAYAIAQHQANDKEADQGQEIESPALNFAETPCMLSHRNT